MHKSGTGYNGCDIEQDSRAVSDKAGDIAKDDLSHGKVRTDVEHIDLSIWMEQEIEHCSGQAAGQKKTDTFPPSRP